MARNLKKGIDYFPHDTGMSNDPKIEMLEYKFGLVGYAIFNKLLEISYKNGQSIDFSNPDIIEYYSLKWKVNNLSEILKFMIEKNLFTSYNLTSDSMSEVLNKINKERERKRSAYTKTNDSDSKKLLFDFESVILELKRLKIYEKYSKFDLKHYYDSVIVYCNKQSFIPDLSKFVSLIVKFINNDCSPENNFQPVLTKKEIDVDSVVLKSILDNIDTLDLSNLNPDTLTETVYNLYNKCKTNINVSEYNFSFIAKRFLNNTYNLNIPNDELYKY